MYDADVAIVGAGLTGLRAALEITRGGLSCLVVEGAQSVGGRLKTSIVNGARLDHGFQVLLSGYPELASLPSLESLGCKPFWSGARIRLDSRVYDILDPRRHPRAFFSTLASPVISFRDLFRLAFFMGLSSNRGIIPSGESVYEALNKAGFSEICKGAFLRPFLRGVLLDPSLCADAGLARFYLRVFSTGQAVLPKGGMQVLPELLADTLGRQHILLATPVARLTERAVVLQNGDEIRAKKIICATDALSAAALGSPEQTIPQLGTTTIYFLGDKPPFSEPLLFLNGDDSGVINNLAVLTNVQPEYTSDGSALMAASILGEHALKDDETLVGLARQQLHGWFGSQTADWECLKVFRISNALPARPRLSSGFREHNGVLYAGDYLSYGSQNGALLAGRAAAQWILAEGVG